MIFDKKSNYMLKYEKSKAKLVEFNVEKGNYPRFPLNPDDLSYTTFYALSLYCEEMIENPLSPLLQSLKTDLIFVSQYFDSTVNTKNRQDYDDLFLLLGSTSYFLSENFGSAKVLIDKIDISKYNSTVVKLLYITLKFLLTGKWMDFSIENGYSKKYLSSIKGHFEEGDSIKLIFDVLFIMRNETQRSDSILDVNYIDFLFSVTICAIEHSSWILLPHFSNASSYQWKNYLVKQNSVKLLWPAQKIIFQSGALIGNDLVVPLPTGVGKTKSIEILLRARFMGQESSVAIVIAPLRALCNEITEDLSTFMTGEAAINQLSDTTQEDFNLDLQSNTNYVFVCTPEKFSYILRHNPEFLQNILLFVFDESHLFDDSTRGAQYELLVSEIARNRNKSSQMILFSAVLANSNQISKWLFNDETATIDYSLVKSTEKSIGFISSDQTIHYYQKDNMEEESFFVPKSIDFANLQLRKRERKHRIFPEINSHDIAIYYACKLCKKGGAAIYAGQVRSIMSIMRRLIEINLRGFDLSNVLANSKYSEIVKLSNLLALHYGNNFELTQAAKLGVFPHYAHLPNGIKLAIEYSLRKHHISFVVCTTTLAEGVNIPIKYLFLTTFSFGTSTVQTRKIQNMVGRTARSGIHTEGSAIVTDPKFYDRRLSLRDGGNYKWNDCKKMFDYGNTEACTSAILRLVSNFETDYQSYYPADAINSIILENYSNPTFYSILSTSILDAYRIYVNDEKKYDRYAPEIKSKIIELENVIQSIENYLCYIYNWHQCSENFVKEVGSLVTQTFAYFLGDDNQKYMLSTFFQLVAQNIVSKVDSNNAAYYAKSLYGIDLSTKVFAWVNDNISILGSSSLYQLLEAIVKLFVELFQDNMSINYDPLIDISIQWISGESYVNIYNNIQQKLTMSQIERLCSSTLSYHLCFLIGNILDAVGGRVEIMTEQLTILQKLVRYGVSTKFEVYVCENLFDDRLIARKLNELYEQTEVTEKSFRELIIEKKRSILSILNDYPEFFLHKFNLFTL